MTDCDFLVLGAGSAGCALANRLSANPSNRVTLLEAGGKDANPWIHLPVGYYKTMHDPRYSWGYETEPVPQCKERRIVWPRGKVLGGSSAINGLVYTRGQAQDYDHWRQLGNAGWSFDDVLPYFKRAENQERGADAYHGDDGPLSVSDLRLRHPLAEAYIKAAGEAGIARNDDFNGETQEGAGFFQLTTRNGLRASAASAYLRPARNRTNLRVETNATVLKVGFSGRHANSVTYRQNGEQKSLQVAREIIICAGAINTPQILQLSGVGPGALLREHGIAVVHELEGVGRNLQDHFQARLVYESTRPTLNDEVRRLDRRIAMGLRWLFKRDGPLTVGAGQVGIFARTRRELATPDIQFHLILLSADKPGKPVHDFSGFTSSVCQLRPESRGYIEIKSTDPLQHPTIQPNYLDAATDRETMIDAVLLARKIGAMPAITDLIKNEQIPGPDTQSRDDILEYVRATGGTIFHPAGTCKMGTDDAAVVDERLRIRGVEGLRVADASIMPTVISANTNAPCIMIGEKAADMILEDARMPVN